MRCSFVLRIGAAVVLPVVLCLLFRYVLFFQLISDGGWEGIFRSAHELADAREFARLLEEYGGELEQVKKTSAAPAVYPENLPINLGKLPVPDKTTIFISLILPNVILVNEEIQATRERILELLDRQKSYHRLSKRQEWWLNRVAWNYGCDPMDREELLKRVDVIPVDLALAQAINESGWGTSRFALEGNNLYGQHFPTSSKGKYLISQHGRVKVAAFDSIYEATRSYMHNLNSVWAYARLREMRAQMRSDGELISGYELAEGLERYSELGQTYVRDLRSIIQRYELEPLNKVKIEEDDRHHIVKFVR